MGASDKPFRDEATLPSSGAPPDQETHLLVFGAITLSHPVVEGTILTIGRSLEADLCLDDPSLSRLHARIEIGPATTRGSGLMVEDLGSRNGTRVRGEIIEPNIVRTFDPGDPITVGDCTLLVQRGVNASKETAAEVDPDIIVEDEAMKRLYDLSGRIAPSDLSLLILGETGVGKEVLARSIHERSRRSQGPFMALNCGAFTDTLLESELFGHVRGAFTGAVASKDGLFVRAEGGTLFLDEVGEMAPQTQVKLLRVLEERQVRPVGGLDNLAIDVRLIAATNKNLESEVHHGSFREDLYYRLNGMSLEIPPLRARRKEIVHLARAFAGPGKPLTDEAIKRLREHDWPGNVRELKNVIDRAVVLAGNSPIDAEHMPMARPKPETSQAKRAAPLKNEIEELERQRIIQALEESAGNQSKAAKLLGMSRKTFVRRLDQYDIPRPRKGRGDAD